MKTSRLITRRAALATGVAALGGLVFTRYPKELPPTYGNLLRMGDTLTYAAHRTLLPKQSLVREYDLNDVTSFPATGETNPGKASAAYRELQTGSFGAWRLSVEGRVAAPRTFTLEE